MFRNRSNICNIKVTDNLSNIAFTLCFVNCEIERNLTNNIFVTCENTELHEMTVLEQIQNKYIVDLMRGTSGDSFTTRLINTGVLRSTNQGMKYSQTRMVRK